MNQTNTLIAQIIDGIKITFGIFAFLISLITLSWVIPVFFHNSRLISTTYADEAPIFMAIIAGVIGFILFLILLVTNRKRKILLVMLILIYIIAGLFSAYNTDKEINKVKTRQGVTE